MECDSDSDLELTPPNIVNRSSKISNVKFITGNIKECAFNLFLEWKANQNAKSFSENVVMVYFGDLFLKTFKKSE
jgi:hypothetical protein